MSLDWRTFAIGSAFFAALTAIFGLMIFARHEWQRPNDVSAKGLAFLVLSGVATGLSWLCYYRALQTGPASRVAPIDKLSVVLVVLFATTILGERMTWKVMVGSALITAGAVLTAL